MSKSIILSSAGLKNLVLQEATADSSNEFTFIIGPQKIQMNKLFAEFLSPKVSHLHHCDPTIDSISYNSILCKLPEAFNKNINVFFPDPVISMVKQISSGSSIKIEKKYVLSLRFLSILFGNTELLSIIDSSYPEYITNMSIDEKIGELQLFHLLYTSIEEKTEQKLIEQISIQFNSIDKTILKKLPKSILHLIITNENLKKR